MDRIGLRLRDDYERERFDRLSAEEKTETYYNYATGMSYEYAADLGLLAVYHVDIGLVTWYYATHDQFAEFLDGQG